MAISIGPSKIYIGGEFVGLASSVSFGPATNVNYDGYIEKDFSTLELPPTEINELGSKLAAKVLLLDKDGRVIVPSRDEWIGVNLLERDDDLPPRAKEVRSKLTKPS